MNCFTKKRLIILFFTTLIAATLVTFQDITNQQFLDWDDNRYVNSNSHIRSLSISNVYWMFTDFDTNNWHPITWLSYAFNYHFWGENATIFKFTNVIIHILTCLVLFLLARKLILYTAIKKPNISEKVADNLAVYSSVIATFLFALHPQHIESVIWISGRKDLLCTLFYLLGIYSYLKQHTSNDNNKWHYATPLFFILSLMSKSMAVTFPILLIFVDIFVLDKLNNKSTIRSAVETLIKNKAAYLLISFCVGLIAIITQANQIRSIEKLSLIHRLLNSSDNILHHFITLVYPEKLSPYHPFSSTILEYDIYSFFSLALVLLITGGVAYAWKKGHKHLLAVWLAYIVMLLPVAGVLSVGHASVSDRYAYLPTTVIFILVGFYISYFVMLVTTRRTPKALTNILVICIIFSLSVSTASYATHWRNDKNLWTYAIKKYPRNAALASINLGFQYSKEKRNHDAIIMYLNALYFDSHNQYALEYTGISFMQLHNEEIGINYFRKLVEIRPDLAVGYLRMGDYNYAHNNIESAFEYYNGAIAVSPNDPDVILRSALIDFTTNNLSSAITKLNYLTQLNPANFDALKLLAKAELRVKNYETAEKIARQMLVLMPNNAASNEILAQIKSEKL